MGGTHYTVMTQKFLMKRAEILHGFSRMEVASDHQRFFLEVFNDIVTGVSVELRT